MRTALSVKFPDHQGKYREFSRFRLSSSRFADEKASPSFRFLAKFPTQQNRELFSSNREFNRRIREFSSENRETAWRLNRRDKPGDGSGSLRQEGTGSAGASLACRSPAQAD